MIAPLSESVRSQITSSVEITSLVDAVEQLLRNALDADASNVRIEVDFKKGFCAVIDNGCGIPAEEFGEDGNLARPHCTSKSSQNACYGKTGQALACISALALVSITSCTPNGCAHSLLLHQSKRISNGQAVGDTAHDIKPSGTKVVIHNLFGNLAVRFKAQAARSSTPAELEKQFLQLKRRLVGYVLSFPNALDLRLAVRDTKLKYQHKALFNRTRSLRFSANIVQSVLRQAGFASATEAGSWKVASAKASELTIRAAICMIPSPSKECQFISLACQPIQRTGLGALFYDKVNELFDVSTFAGTYEMKGEKKTDSSARLGHVVPESTRARNPDGYVKSVDRWPSFYIRIDTRSNEFIAELSSRYEGEHETSNALQRVMSLLITLVEQMLQSQQLRPGHIEGRKENHVLKPRENTRVPSSRANFDGWSRARAAYAANMESRCEGLPFVADGETPSLDMPLDVDVQLLLDDMCLDSGSSTPAHTLTPADEAVQTESSSHSQGFPAADDDCVTWSNPRTGKTVRLNNHGFVVPSITATGGQALSDPHDTCPNYLAPGQRLPKKAPTVKEIAERLRQWPSHTFTSQPELALPSVAMDFEATSVTLEQLSSTIEQRVSTHDLACARVLGQVDQKFILALVPTHDSGDNLVLIDQHAADERVKVEELYRELCSAAAMGLTRPIILEFGEEEAQRFEGLQTYFASWGICYQRGEMAGNTIRVTHLPNLIAERCRQDPRILIDLLRREVWTGRHRAMRDSWSKDSSWVDRMAHCPAGLVELVNSRACRTAIMFNDVLTADQCTDLVRKLARCTLPFQCAHGRPSLTVMTNLGYLDLGVGQDSRIGFAEAFKRWT